MLLSLYLVCATGVEKKFSFQQPVCLTNYNCKNSLNCSLESTICDDLHCWITCISFLNVFSHLHISRHQTCSFKIVISFTKVKKGVQTYLALCEKVTAPKISLKPV